MKRRPLNLWKKNRITRYLVKKIVYSPFWGPKVRDALSSQEAQALNRRVLKLSLEAAGYNPEDDSNGNGEALLAHVLANLGLKSALDVGANRGLYSERLLRAGFDRVLAIEPLPHCEPSLAALKVRFEHQFSFRSVAVGKEAGSLPIFFDPQNLVLASMSKAAQKVPYVKYSETLTVPVTSVDLLSLEMQEQWDLMKIDTEGFEAEVLAGSSAFLASSPPKVIQLEFNQHQLFRGHSLLSLYELLPEGYESYRLLPGSNGLTKVDPSSPYSNIFLFSNFVFVREDFVQSFDEAMRGR